MAKKIGADPGVLTTLNVALRHHNTKTVEAAPDGNEIEPGNNPEVHRRHHTIDVADRIAQGRLTLANIQTLSAEQLAVLASFGWRPERLAAAAALVEAYAAAHAAELEVRQWDKQFTNLARLEIKQADPDNRRQLLELLSL